jgi:IS30 family transposase
MVVECKSWYAVLTKVSNKMADYVGSAIIEAFKLFEAKVKALNYYNGKESSGHARIDEALGRTVVYFVWPLGCWERRSNENFNGLLR